MKLAKIGLNHENYELKQPEIMKFMKNYNKIPRIMKMYKFMSGNP